MKFFFQWVLLTYGTIGGFFVLKKMFGKKKDPAIEAAKK